LPLKGHIQGQTNLRNSMFVHQETVSIHDKISVRKLQSLGKCHNENMSKAACVAVIVACAMEEETIYRRG
jgi:hypothetical protein